MADKIRVGIIGASVNGSWSTRSHIPALGVLPEYELKAIATTRQETADASAKAFGAELAFGDYREMVRHPDIDLVAVCVRVPHHYELTMEALRAGKHVYTEWPLGANTAEAEQMASLARDKGVHTAIGLQGRQDPGLNYMKSLVESGYVGEVLTCNVTLFRGGGTSRPLARTWQRDKRLGATGLSITGAHTIDCLRHLMGDFAEVAARVMVRSPKWYATDTQEWLDNDGPDTVLISGLLESGVPAGVHVAMVPVDKVGGRIEVYGREGTLIGVFPEGPNIGPVEVMGAQGAAPLETLPIPDSFRHVPEHTPKDSAYNVAQVYSRLADDLASGDHTVPDFDEALRLHRLLDVIQRASDEGRTLRFE